MVQFELATGGMTGELTGELATSAKSGILACWHLIDLLIARQFATLNLLRSAIWHTAPVRQFATLCKSVRWRACPARRTGKQVEFVRVRKIKDRTVGKISSQQNHYLSFLFHKTPAAAAAVATAHANA